VDRVAELVQRLATGWTVQGLNPGGGRDFPHPSRLALGPTQPHFPGVKSGRGVTLTLHPLLVLWSWQGRAIPLLPLWTVQPVQSLSACMRAHFTFFSIKNLFSSEFIDTESILGLHSSWQPYLSITCHLEQQTHSQI